MKKAIHNQFSTIYQKGNKMILNSSWEDCNVIVPNNKFYFVCDGEIEIIANGISYVVCKNEWLLIPAGVLHSYKLTRTQYAKLYWIHFEVSSNNKSFFSGLSSPVKIKTTQSAQITTLFNKIFKCHKSNTLTAQLDVATNVNNLVCIFLNNLPKQVLLKNNDDIDDVIAFITLNYSENFTLLDLAKKAHLSVSQFINRFKQRTGISPIYYIILTRLEHAKYLLEQTSFSITTIMQKVGYTDCSHFSQIFKKYYGLSPLKYRCATQPIINGYVIK